MAKVEIVPNDLPKEKEDRFGRVRVSHARTYILFIDDEAWGEYKTRKDAEKAAKRRGHKDEVV